MILKTFVEGVPIEQGVWDQVNSLAYSQGRSLREGIMPETIVHLSPSNLNSWDDLRKANDDSPPWINPESFKKSILGVYEPSIKAGAGNAVHGFVFEGLKTHEDCFLDSSGTLRPCNFIVDDDFLQFRKMFPFGKGVAEVSKVLYLPEEIDGCRIRISQRLDYLSEKIITEMKTSSKSFRAKGVISGFMESQQSFSYTYAYKRPIRFLFAEIAIKENDEGIHMINLKNADCATAYPCDESNRRFLDCIRSLIPYLKNDPEMWYRVTNRTLQDEF